MAAARILRTCATLVLLADCQLSLSYVARPVDSGLILRKTFHPRCGFKSYPSRKNSIANLKLSLEEDLGKPFGEFGKKIGRSIDWFFDTSHVTGGVCRILQNILSFLQDFRLIGFLQPRHGACKKSRAKEIPFAGETGGMILRTIYRSQCVRCDPQSLFPIKTATVSSLMAPKEVIL
jgi:hypothetical protein